MTESGHEKIARRLRELAERIEREPLPAGTAGRAFGLLAGLEALLAKTRGEAAQAPEAAAAPALPAEPGTARIWSDGSCAPNPGPGGWAAIVDQDGAREEISGGDPASTNNIMEMTAALEGLRRVPPGTAVTVTSDSRYLVDAMSRWLPGWKRKGWRKADGQPVLNRELWEKLDELARVRRVRWVWIEGHAGHPENERCDELANAARERIQARGVR